MKIRLTRKFAELINGIDLSKFHAGETVDLSPKDAQLLMAEGWAEFEGPQSARDKAHDRVQKRKSSKTPRKKR
jgi:hypothetical protein